MIKNIKTLYLFIILFMLQISTVVRADYINYTFPDGSKYVGGWENDKKYGRGLELKR